jgi:hypothetical protein
MEIFNFQWQFAITKLFTPDFPRQVDNIVANIAFLMFSKQVTVII